MEKKHMFELLAEETPGLQKVFLDLISTIKSDAGLDEKTFQLVYIGISAHRGETGSVIAHVGPAKRAGATRDEVRGAVLVSLMTCGVAGIRDCLQAALDTYDNA